MNNTRRKQIAAAQALLAQAAGIIEEARQALEEVRDEEQDAYDNMPESFQVGEKGDRAMAAIDNLENAISDLESLDFDSLGSILDEAAE